MHFSENKISSKCVLVLESKTKYWGILLLYFAHLNALEMLKILFLCFLTESLRNDLMIYSPSCRSFLLNSGSYWAGQYDVHAIFLLSRVMLSLRSRSKFYSLIIHKETKTLLHFSLFLTQSIKWLHKYSTCIIWTAVMMHSDNAFYITLYIAWYGLQLWCIWYNPIMHFILLYTMHHMDYSYDAFR